MYINWLCYRAQAHTSHTQQANKPRDELLGQGIMTLFRKPANQEDGEVTPQRTIWTGLEVRPYTKRGGKKSDIS